MHPMTRIRWVALLLLACAATAWAQQGSISDAISRDKRNWFGFVLGAFGYYDNNLLGTIDERRGDSAAAISPGIFFNFAGQRTALHTDYRFTYRRYVHNRDLDARNHEGGFELTRRLSRRTSLSLADHARSGPNDILGITGAGSARMVADAEIGRQFFFDQQRLLTNYLSARFTAETGRRNRFNITAGYNTYRYRTTRREDTDTIQAGLSDEYRLTRKLSLSGEVTNDWVDSSSDIRDGRILRALGGPRWQITRYWEAFGRAGMERVSQGGAARIGETYEASLSRTTDSSRIELRYQRRAGVQLGLRGVNRYETARAGYDRRLTSWMSGHLYSTYYRTDRLDRYGRLESVGGSAGFEFLLRHDLVATAFGHYLYQTQKQAVLGRFDVDRYIVFAGLQYYFAR